MSFAFDGSSGRARITGSAPTWYTVSVWFYPTTIQDGVIYQQYKGSVPIGSQYYRLKLVGATSKINWESTNGLNTDLLDSTGTVSVNAWNHLYFTRDVWASPNQWRMSLNGAAFDSGTSSVYPTVSAQSIGAAVSGTTWSTFFAGQIAELALWNDTLSYYDGAYEALYNGYSSLDIHREYLVRYWPLANSNETTPTILRDVVANENWTLAGTVNSGDHCRVLSIPHRLAG